MTSINPDIQARIQTLPAKQQKHFHELLEDGDADSLRQDLVAGDIDKDFQLTTQYAIAALSDSHSEGPFPTEQEARGGYRNEIRRLREIDPDSEIANHLEAMLINLSEREEADQERAEATREKAEKLQLQREEDQLAAYQKAYADHKAMRVAELSRFNLMDAEQAEARFMQLEHASLSASLKRHHGIAE